MVRPQILRAKHMFIQLTGPILNVNRFRGEGSIEIHQPNFTEICAMEPSLQQKARAPSPMLKL